MTKEYEKKMRYFVIGEDTPINKSKVIPCGHFGVTETIENNERKIQTIKSTNADITKSIPINTKNSFEKMTDFGKITDKAKKLGIEIKINV